MADSSEERLKKVETEVQKLKDQLATSETPVIGLAIVVALIGYIAIVKGFPFPQSFEGGERFWIGVACAMGAMVVLGGSLEFTKFALKALVEICIVLVALGNALWGLTLVANLSNFQRMILEIKPMEDGEALFLVFLAGAVILFLVDVVVFLALYPLAKSAGSSSLD